MTQIKRIGIKQTAKVSAVFYFIFSLLFVVPMSVMTIIFGTIGDNKTNILGATFGGILLIIVPLIYSVMGFTMVALFSFIYNQIAKRVGGIEIELEPKIKKSSSK